MAARLNRRHQESIREKIRGSQLVNRLEDHILGDLELSATQVTAALGLLKKVVPDLSSMDSNVFVTDQRQLNEYSTAELLTIRDKLSATEESGSAGETAKLHDVH